MQIRLLTILKYKSISKISDPIERIKEKIKLLKSLDFKYSIFGSEKHKYNNNKPLKLEEIANFEKLHNITLPNEYKRFLTEIGNGGVGPYYGLYEISEFNTHYCEHIWEDSDMLKTYLDMPFPHKERWDPPSRGNEDPEQDFNGIYGTMAICTEGCGYVFTLIVSGEEKGNIWFDGMVSRQGVMPLVNQKTSKKYNFFDWYEEWLDTSILKLLQ